MEQMEQKKHKPMIRKSVHRVMTILLAAVVLVMSIPAYPAETAADETASVTFKKITLWRWERVYTRADAHKGGYCLLFWGGDDRSEYFAVGHHTDDDDDLPGTLASSVKGMNGAASGFYTETNRFIPGVDESCWYAKYHEDYNNMPRFVFYANDWDLYALHADNTCDMEFPKCDWSTSDLKDFSHCVATGEDINDVPWDCVWIYRHDGSLFGSDEKLGVTGSGKYISLYESKIDNDRKSFHMFYGHQVSFTLMPDVTVPSGTTMKIEGHMILDEGCTLTVEPGAVLTVSGEFINNGTIENCGTVVLQPGAQMYSAMLSGKSTGSCGSILCVGQHDNLFKFDREGEGNLVILDGAVLAMPDNESILVVGRGASVVNNGILVVPNSLLISDGELINTKNGVVFLGKTAQEDMYVNFDMRYTGDASMRQYLAEALLDLSDSTSGFGLMGTGRTVSIRNDGNISCSFRSVYVDNPIENNGEIEGIDGRYIK